MPPDVDASDRVPSCRSHSHGPPLLGRVRVASKFPDVNARMQPSDFLASISRDFGSPCRRPTSMQSRRGEDLPGYWAVLFVRAVVQHPAGRDPALPLLLFEKIHGEDALAFAK